MPASPTAPRRVGSLEDMRAKPACARARYLSVSLSLSSLSCRDLISAARPEASYVPDSPPTMVVGERVVVSPSTVVVSPSTFVVVA